MIRAATWLVSFAAHGVLVVFTLSGVLSDRNTSFDAGAGDDTFKIEQGIGIEGIVQEGTAVETVVATEVPQEVSQARPEIEEVKPTEVAEAPQEAANLPKDTEVIQSQEGPTDDVVPLQEEVKPEEVQQAQAPQMATLEQSEQVAVEEQKSAGEKQDGGNAGVRRAYLGRLHNKLQRSKVNPQSRATGTVLVRFAVSPQGTLLSREVVSSSGSQVLDEAALAALDRAAPFPAFPEDLKLEKIVEVVPYRFSVR